MVVLERRRGLGHVGAGMWSGLDGGLSRHHEARRGEANKVAVELEGGEVLGERLNTEREVVNKLINVSRTVPSDESQ